MKYHKILALLATVCSASSHAAMNQAQLVDFTEHAQFWMGTTSNFSYGDSAFDGEWRIVNQSTQSLPAGRSDWAIYVHSIRMIDSRQTAGLNIKHINGDLFELTPSAEFAGLAAGQTLSLPFKAAAWAAHQSDYMPRAFFYQPGLPATVFKNTNSEHFADFVLPFDSAAKQLRYQQPQDLQAIATAASRYARNQQLLNGLTAAQVQGRIVPSPAQVELSRGEALLTNDWQLVYQGRLSTEAKWFAEQWQQRFGQPLTLRPEHETNASKNVILFRVSDRGVRVNQVQQQREAYRIVVDKESIIIEGSDNAGAFYGLQSMLSLLPAQAANQQAVLTRMTIADAPRFSFRGMHYDIGRNFHGKAVILRMIDNMARYKMNKLHLHLSEDEGWRLAIPGLPELTEIGGNRCFDLSEQRCLLTQLGTGPDSTGSGNGYLSREDFVELLQYAKARHVEVIPEVDLPGHARAAIKAMEARYQRLSKAGQPEAATQYLLSDPQDQSRYLSVQNYRDNAVNVCMASSYRFVDKVVYELQQMYRDAGLALSTMHIGGDEVGKGAWQGSPQCQQLLRQGVPGVAGVNDLKPYFVGKVSALLAQRGIALGAWEDGLMYDANNTFNRKQFANDQVYANVWDNIWEWGVADRAYRLANNGYQVVLSHGSHLYFDHPYEAHPEERGYYWASRYTDSQKVFGYLPDDVYANADVTRQGQVIANLEALLGRELPKLQQPQMILGMQGQVWSESIRTAEQLEMMVYPRLIALAERAWHKATFETAKNPREQVRQPWAEFASQLVYKEVPALLAAGSAVHLPVPGGVVEQGQLRANVAWPGLTIEYQLDGGNWQVYQTPVTLGGASQVLLRSRIGETISRSTAVQ